MAEKSEEIRLNAEQKTALLNLGLEPDTAEPVDKADMLYDILNNPLPLDAASANMLPVPLRAVSRKVRSIAGLAIIELLKSDETSISTLKTIKEYSKRSGKTAESEDMKEIFLSVYYAAIASGLVFHGRKITEHSYAHLMEAFQSLSGEKWLQEGLVDILKPAHEFCKDRVGQADFSNGL